MGSARVWVELFEDISGTGNLVVDIAQQARGRPHVSGYDPFRNAHIGKPFLPSDRRRLLGGCPRIVIYRENE